MAVSLKKLKEQLLSKIDQDNLSEVEKVERYISLLELFRRLDKQAKEEGAIVVTTNGSQTFKKAHPALAELKNVNSQLIATFRSIEFKQGEEVEKVELM